MATALMGMDLPVVSTTIGPTWATQLNAALTVVDSHNHTSGYGALVPTAGLNINADLTFAGYNATTLRSARFSSQASALVVASDLGCVYNVLGDLYWNNGSGTAVKVTSGSGINAAGIGIGGDFSTSTAAVTYTTATKIFLFTQSSGVTAKLSCADVIISEPVSSANTITLKSPVSLASSYSLTLPTALPSSYGKLLASSTTGALSFYDGDNSTIELNGAALRIKDAGVTLAKMAVNSVDSDQYVDGSVDVEHLQAMLPSSATPASGKLSADEVTGSLSTISSTFATISGSLSAAVICKGRPIQVALQTRAGATFPGFGSANSVFRLTATDSGNMQACVKLMRATGGGGATQQTYWLFGAERDGEALALEIPPSAINYLDESVSNGDTYTYSFEWAVNADGATGSLSLANGVKMIAYEI